MHDLRLAARALRRRWGTSLTILAVLGLAIGANALVFSLLRAFLLRPLDVPEPERLVRLFATQAVEGSDRLAVAPATFAEWRRRATAYEALGAGRNMGLSVTESDTPLNPLMREVTPEVFPLLAARARLGRLFSAEEHRETAPVVVLHHDFWQSYYGGEPDVVGRTLELAGRPYEVVGVMDPGYRNEAYPQPPVLWLPMPPPETLPDTLRLVVVGRLAPGVAVERAQEEMDRISADLAAERPDTDGGRGARVLPFQVALSERLRPALLALFVAVGLVLLVACGNVANLVLARTVARREELAVRTALGATPVRLFRQLTLESLLLGGLAAAVGLGAAAAGLPLVSALVPAGFFVPLLDRLALDVPVALYTAGLGIAVTLVFGWLPLLVGRPSADALPRSRGGVGERRGRRLRRSLVVAEVAFALTLVLTAGLTVRSFLHLRLADPGFAPEDLLAIRVGARGPGYESPEGWTELHRQVLARAAAIRGVAAVGSCEVLPMFASFRPAVAVADARAGERPPAERPRAIPLAVGDGFFTASGLPIVRGRPLGPDDRAGGPPVAVVSFGLAQRLWGDDDPVGRTLVLERGEEDGGRAAVEVVGVAGDLRGVVSAPEPPPNVYLPLAQSPVPAVSLLLRTQREPREVFAEVAAAVATISAEAPVYGETVVRQVLRDIEWQPRFVMQLLVAFALLALVLAVTGIYAILAYSVAERRREIGVRMALGADRGRVLRWVLGDALRLAATGAALGLAASWVAGEAVAGLLIGTGHGDALTHLGGIAVIAAAVVAAAALPAWRATRVDPTTALRAE